MPRGRREPIEDHLLDVEEAGLELPDGLAPDAAYRLAAAVAFFAKRRKTVTIASQDLLLVRDAKVTVAVPVRGLEAAASLRRVVQEEAPAARARAERTVLWVDAGGAADPEYAYEQAVWGAVTLYAYPSKPRRPRDERILAAERDGWTPVLKTFNLLPGRGIVVEDGKHGLLVTEPDAAAIAGLVVHTPGGETPWYPNPFVEARRRDADFQYWLVWGEGTEPQEWRTVLEHRGD